MPYITIRNLSLPDGYRIHTGFGGDVEVEHGNSIVFTGTVDEVREWAKAGCPRTALEWDESRTWK